MTPPAPAPRSTSRSSFSPQRSSAQFTIAAFDRNHQCVPSAPVSAARSRVEGATRNLCRIRNSKQRSAGVERARLLLQASTNASERAEHRRAVTKHPHLRLVLVPPVDGDLLHGDVERRCDREDLDIPCKTVLAGECERGMP